MNRHFEKSPLHFKKLFSSARFDWSVIDQALDVLEPRPGMIRLVHRKRIDPSTYLEEYNDIGVLRTRIRKDQLYTLLEEGATLVLNRVELASTVARKICRDIERFFDLQATANAYACLGGDPATGAHWDTHDVLAVQLSGCKRWRLYEPTFPLPISTQVSNGRAYEIDEVAPSIDVVLTEGDGLYVPRGWWHRVEPVKGHDTIHLAVGLHAPLLLDYLIWACSRMLPNRLAFRESFLPGSDRRKVASTIDELTTLLKSDDTIFAFHRRVRERRRSMAKFDIQGLLRDSMGLSVLDRLCVNSNVRLAEPSVINGQPFLPQPDEAQVLEAIGESVSMTLAELKASLSEVDLELVRRALVGLARKEAIEIDREGA